jgi:hypothetical protein
MKEHNFLWNDINVLSVLLVSEIHSFFCEILESIPVVIIIMIIIIIMSDNV